MPTFNDFAANRVLAETLIASNYDAGQVIDLIIDSASNTDDEQEILNELIGGLANLAGAGLKGIGNAVGSGMNAVGAGLKTGVNMPGGAMKNAGNMAMTGAKAVGNAVGQAGQTVNNIYQQGEQGKQLNNVMGQLNSARQTMQKMGFQSPQVNKMFDMIGSVLQQANSNVGSNSAARTNQPGFWQGALNNAKQNWNQQSQPAPATP